MNFFNTQIIIGITKSIHAHSEQIITTNWRESHVYNASALLSSPLRDSRACASTCMCMFSLVFRGGTRRARVHATSLPSLLFELGGNLLSRALTV